MSFSAGEIIEIVEENNADWWTGKCRGRQGLFPSNHAEKISSGPPPAAAYPMSAPVPYSPPGPPQPSVPHGGYGNDRPVYKPFGATYQAVDQPPPASAPVTNSVGLQQAPEPKKSRFGSLGNTVRVALEDWWSAISSRLIVWIDGQFCGRRCRLWRW